MMLAASLQVRGSELAREGKPPLLAVCSMVGDHVVHAVVFDPEDSPQYQAERDAEGKVREQHVVHGGC